MKKLLILCLACALLAPSNLSGQNTAVWFSFGLNASRMDDMKYLQDYILGTYPVEGKISSSFPVYTMGSVGVLNQLYPSIKIGAAYSRSATGGKSNYTDYSGYITTEIDAVSHKLGAYASYLITGGKRLELSAFGRLDINYTQIDITSDIFALGATDRISNRYSSVSPGGTAGLEFLVMFSNFALGLEGGYEVNLPGKLKNRESKSELHDPNDRERILTSDWTGWCVQIKALVWLGR